MIYWYVHFMTVPTVSFTDRKRILQMLGLSNISKLILMACVMKRATCQKYWNANKIHKLSQKIFHIVSLRLSLIVCPYVNGHFSIMSYFDRSFQYYSEVTFLLSFLWVGSLFFICCEDYVTNRTSLGLSFSTPWSSSTTKTHFYKCNAVHTVLLHPFVAYSVTRFMLFFIIIKIITRLLLIFFIVCIVDIKTRHENRQSCVGS